jgi:hypothetical protein
LLFLVKEWRASLVVNDSSLYISENPIGFFIFQTTATDSDFQRCDNHYGYWVNNGTKIITVGDICVRRTYWYDSRNKNFKKQEFHLLQKEVEAS